MIYFVNIYHIRGGNILNKSKKFIVGIVLLILGIVGAVAAFAQGVVSTGFACLLFLAAGIVLIILDKKLPTKENSAAIQSNTSQNTLTTKGTHSQKFKIAGVTYDNRQEHLAKLMQQKLSGQVINVELQEYEYENQPAIKVIANGLDIGSLHSEDALFIKENQNRVKAIKDLYISSFEDEETKEKIYYARLTLTIENKK